jgi:hypothetical protein
MKTRFILGLDVGRSNEPTGFAVIELKPLAKTERESEYHLRHIERIAPGTAYADINRTVFDRILAGSLQNSPLVINQTAVGKAFVDLCRALPFRMSVVPIAVTAGQSEQRAHNGATLVP